MLQQRLPLSLVFFIQALLIHPFHTDTQDGSSDGGFVVALMAPSRALATASSCSSPASFLPLRLHLPKPPIPASLSNVVAVSASATSPNGTILKRKRPTRLDIPFSSLAFGIPPTPSAVARCDVVEEERDAFSIYCKRWRREHMEDRCSAADNLRGQQKLAFFGIFDGHSGAKAAKFVANNLEDNVLDEVILSEEDSIEEAVKRGYVKTDSAFLKTAVVLRCC